MASCSSWGSTLGAVIYISVLVLLGFSLGLYAGRITTFSSTKVNACCVKSNLVLTSDHTTIIHPKNEEHTPSPLGNNSFGSTEDILESEGADLALKPPQLAEPPPNPSKNEEHTPSPLGNNSFGTTEDIILKVDYMDSAQLPLTQPPIEQQINFPKNEEHTSSPFGNNSFGTTEKILSCGVDISMPPIAHHIYKQPLTSSKIEEQLFRPLEGGSSGSTMKFDHGEAESLEEDITNYWSELNNGAPRLSYKARRALKRRAKTKARGIENLQSQREASLESGRARWGARFIDKYHEADWSGATSKTFTGVIWNYKTRGKLGMPAMSETDVLKYSHGLWGVERGKL